jgi:hypothetical protein
VQFELIDMQSKVEILVACPSFVRTHLLEDVKAPEFFVATPKEAVKAILSSVGQDLSTFGTLKHEL